MGVKGATGRIDQKSFAQAYSAAVDKYNSVVTPLGLPAYSKADVPETVDFKADYAVHAIVPAIGLSYSF